MTLYATLTAALGVIAIWQTCRLHDYRRAMDFTDTRRRLAIEGLNNVIAAVEAGDGEAMVSALVATRTALAGARKHLERPLRRRTK